MADGEPRHSSAVCAAARKASRLIRIGVDPECRLADEAEHVPLDTEVPMTAPVGSSDSSTGPCSMCSSR